MKSLVSAAVVLMAMLLPGSAADQPRVFVYTKNQAGADTNGHKFFIHDNIPASVAAIKKLGAENQFDVEASDDPGAFTDDNLRRFKVVIFDNANNEVFDNEQEKAAFQRYIRAGGAFVGIHSACGAMRHWPWYWAMSGGTFHRHAKLQTFTIRVKDKDNPSTAHLPASFQWTDEFYYLNNRPDDLHVLLAGDLATLDDPQKDKERLAKYGDEIPLAWCHQYDGGREWFTTLGHQKEHYDEPMFTKHLLGGILWAMGRTQIR